MTDKVYEFLSAPRETTEELRRKRQKRTQIWSTLSGGAIRYDLPRVQTSPHDRMADVMAEIDELDQEISRLRSLRRKQRQDIIDATEILTVELSGRCLILHYVDGLKWSDVARAVHKSESTVFRYHRQAVFELDQYVDNMFT